ncbi:MAG: glycosyltransferase [Bacteroidales bacterium]|nr:glycosyltransferase [Bacteroidales bacterium]
MNRIFVSVINDMTNDQRVNRICNTLCDMGFDVVVLCRKLKSSAELEPCKYKVKRFHLLFNKGFLFYASFNLRIFFYLLFHHCDLLLANDLDTLLGNALVSKLKRKKLYYDTHELFTELPELQDSGFKKKIWLWIERRCIHRPVATYTVCDSIANYYNDKYDLDMKVVRNLPISKEIQSYENRENILLYQGALNMGRGIELLIEMMKHFPDYKLYIAGKGYMDSDLKKLTANLNLTDRVVFTGNLRFDELHKLTSRAKIGFSVEQGESLNYKYALPNKLFDYIQAGTPVVCSDFPEMRAVVEEYAVGEIFAGHDAESLAALVKNMLDNDAKLIEYHDNCIEASKVLNWENEQKILYGIYEGE